MLVCFVSGVRDVAVLSSLTNKRENQTVPQERVRFTRSRLRNGQLVSVDTDGARHILILPDSSCS